MAFVIHLAEAALETVLWLLTFRGWGEWLAAGKLIPVSEGRFRDFVRTVFGLCAFTVFLLLFVYSNIPLQYPSWLALFIGIGGLTLLWKKHWKTGKVFPITSSSESFLTLSVFAVIWFLQGLPIFRIGPVNYAAFGHIDLYTYVSTSQFLAEKPFYSSPADGMLNPWIQNAIVLRHLRQGANTILAYTSVITGQDTQAAFGPVILFFTALTSVSVWFCLRQFGLPSIRAWLFGIWIGLAHGITYSITASFFSSIAVLFGSPFFVGIVWRYRRHLIALRLAPALLLSYIFLTYTELFPWIALFCILVWVISIRKTDRRIWRQMRLNFLAFGTLSLIYLPHALASQLDTWNTVSQQPEWFKLLSNNSGSWQGWRQLFFATITSQSLPWLNALTLLTALVFLGIIAGGFFVRRSAQNQFLIPITLYIAFWPLVLLGMPTFQPYAFFKLSITFLPVFYILLAIFWQRIEDRFFPINIHFLFTIVIAGLVIGSLLSSSLFWIKIVRDQDALPVNTPIMRATRDYVRRHPEKIYYIDDTNEVRAGWLAYYARHSRRVYLSPRTHLVWGFGANKNAMPPLPPYTVLRGDTPPVDIPDYSTYEAH